jgi:hypothetical protein
VLAGAGALNELRAMAYVCVRTGTAGLSLVSIVTTVLASDHRAAVLYRSEMQPVLQERKMGYVRGRWHACHTTMPKGRILQQQQCGVLELGEPKA